MPTVSPHGTEDLLEELVNQLRTPNRNGNRIEYRERLKKLKLEVDGLMLLTGQKPKRQTKLERCKVWLAGLLGTVPREMRAIYRQAKEDDCSYSRRTIQRALLEMGVVYIKSGYRCKQRWHAALPENLSKMLASLRNLASPKARKNTTTPTPHKPGTPEHDAELRRRAAAGLPLHHEQDARLTDRDNLTLETWDGNGKPKGKRLAG